jgi:Kef-type K+ transport system membrane component KefB
MSFGTLAVIVLAGLGGPLLGMLGHRFVPVVIGEILAGIIVGPAVLGAVNPSNTTISFLADVGFAMLMLTAGMHLPLSDQRLARSAKAGAVAAGLVCLLAVPAGLLAAAIAGAGHAALYAVVLASGSAAVLVPAIEEGGLAGPEVLRVIAQVTIADVVTIVSVPIVLQPARAGHAGLAAVLVAAAAGLLLLTARELGGAAWVHRVRHRSKQRYWALDLRFSLLALFVLAWIAEKGGTSILIAGFAAGVMVALVGGPKRLSTQTRGIADGFFIPLYFVVLGARLDLGGVLSSPSMLGLAAALAGLTVGIRLLAAAVLRRPVAGALAASAQLGVPAAVASLGITEQVITPVVATAIVVSALVSLGFCTLGVEMLAAREPAPAQTPVAG